jgi:hypothetical protein
VKEQLACTTEWLDKQLVSTDVRIRKSDAAMCAGIIIISKVYCGMVPIIKGLDYVHWLYIVITSTCLRVFAVVIASRCTARSHPEAVSAGTRVGRWSARVDDATLIHVRPLMTVGLHFGILHHHVYPAVSTGGSCKSQADLLITVSGRWQQKASIVTHLIRCSFIELA